MNRSAKQKRIVYLKPVTTDLVTIELLLSEVIGKKCLLDHVNGFFEREVMILDIERGGSPPRENVLWLEGRGDIYFSDLISIETADYLFVSEEFQTYQAEIHQIYGRVELPRSWEKFDLVAGEINENILAKLVEAKLLNVNTNNQQKPEYRPTRKGWLGFNLFDSLHLQTP